MVRISLAISQSMRQPALNHRPASIARGRCLGRLAVDGHHDSTCNRRVGEVSCGFVGRRRRRTVLQVPVPLGLGWMGILTGAVPSMNRTLNRCCMSSWRSLQQRPACAVSQLHDSQRRIRCERAGQSVLGPRRRSLEQSAGLAQRAAPSCTRSNGTRDKVSEASC